MATWLGTTLDLLWHNALAAISPAIIIALICCCIRCRPVTRHALWLMVLLFFILPPISSRWHLQFREWWDRPRASQVGEPVHSAPIAARALGVMEGVAGES